MRTPLAPRRLGMVILAAVVALVGVLPFAAVERPQAQEDTVDLTVLFHSAVQGKVAPCG